MPVLRQVFSAIDMAWRSLTGQSAAAHRAIQRTFVDNFDGLVIFSEDERVLASSKTATRLLLRDHDRDITGMPASEILPHSVLEAVQRVFREGFAAAPTPLALAAIGDPREDGLIIQYVVNLSDMPGQKRIASLTFWDETDRRKREEHLAFMGTHDHLTGALVRSELVKLARNALANDKVRRNGLSMLLVDLSRFKSVNDTLGHSFGDLLLKQVVSRIKAAGIQTVARLGGDVFAVLHLGRLAGDEAETFCKTLIERLVLPYSAGGHRAIIGVALGLTSTDISGSDPEVLISHADMALSVAKDLPGNNYVRFSKEMDERLKQKQDMEIALRQAIDRDEFSITYQPQIALETGKMVGVEALVRWQHPRLGLVSPDQFIPAAEETGQIIELGQRVLEIACREVVAWPEETRLAVNVSPIQFELSDVVSDVREALRQSGLPPHRLDVEITEGMFVSKAQSVIDTLQKLRDLGVGIALDDFGTGYSSLSYLGRLPVDKIKIDQSFVHSLPGDTEAGAIIRAVLTLSETLDKVVIAEGIENADQAWMLRMMGCKIGQGFHFGRPRTSAEMVEWFADRAETLRAKAG